MPIRRNSILIMTAILASQNLFFMPMILAQQVVPTKENYSTLMREIDFTIGDAELHIDQKYWGDLGTDTDALKILMEQILEFWNEQNSTVGIEHASQALKTISLLSQASGQGRESEARQAVQRLKQHLTAIKDLDQNHQIVTIRSTLPLYG